MSEEISAEFPFESKFVEVKGSKMHYIDIGEGDPILFLHGNPTSNYLWRNIIPYLTPFGRCIAPDQIGMGKSGKPDIDYGFSDSYDYIEKFIEKLNLKNITLVLHDWGSGVGFHYAHKHPEKIKAIAFMEAMIKTYEWSSFPPQLQMMLKMLRGRFSGWFLGQFANMFIKKMLPDMIIRKLTKEEKQIYAAPYSTIKSRKPLIVWPKSVPVGGKPEDVHQAVSEYIPWLFSSKFPKLLLHSQPGTAILPEDVENVRQNMTNVSIVDAGEGIHFIQEDNPHGIGKAIADWYSTV